MIKLQIQKSLSDFSEDKIKYLSDFLTYCKKRLSIEGDLNIKLIIKKNNLNITTGGYTPDSTNLIYSVAEGRALVDILRTLCHEMVHMRQNELGQIQGEVQDIGGIIEDTANAISGRLIKMFVRDTNDRTIYYL